MTTYFETKDQYITFRTAWAKAAQAKQLTAAHMVMFNILCGRPHDRGFTPITKTTKLLNGAYLNHGLYFAVDDLKRIVGYAKSVVGSKEAKLSSWNQDRLEDFLKPFDGVITVELLASVEVPEVKPLESNWAKGLKVAQKIIASERKPISYADLEALYKEVA